jgi:hypothetical protein
MNALIDRAFDRRPRRHGAGDDLPEEPEGAERRAVCGQEARPASLKRSLPDGRTVEVYLAESQKYEEAGELVKSFRQSQPKASDRTAGMRSPESAEAPPPNAPEPESPQEGGRAGSYLRIHITVGPSPQLLKALAAGWKIVGFSRPKPN